MVTRPTSRKAAGSVVRLRFPDGVLDLPWPTAGRALRERQRLAFSWVHIVRNRSRWTHTPSSIDARASEARGVLESLGIRGEDRQRLATSRSVVVDLPWTTGDAGWEARMLPWEYLLTAGTCDIRQGHLVVTRTLRHRPPRRLAAPSDAVLFVKSAPGKLGDEWDFTDEHRMVEAYYQHGAVQVLESPSRKELADALRATRPGIVHLAGFDAFEGLSLLGGRPTSRTQDGYLLSGVGGAVDAVPAEALATLFDAEAPPVLVFCSTANSAARIAPALVASGTGAVVALQDAIDEGLAGSFIGEFYRALGRGAADGSPLPLQDAFCEGLRTLHSQQRQSAATGIVLWEDSSAPARPVRAAPPGSAARLDPDLVSVAEARGLLAFSVVPRPEVSFALLHNARSIFSDFTIRKLDPRHLDGVQVQVELHAGAASYPFRQSFALEEASTVLTERVSLALTGDLTRTLDEMLRTSIYVSVRWGRHLLYEATFPVTLAPADQWSDTDEDRHLLPSFVLPRDGTVARIIGDARQYVAALRDDPRAGFDGYEPYTNPLMTDPALEVDRQVQALWCALGSRIPLSYMNPPPTYSTAAQRIRMPAEVVERGFGTCIDLALTFAACLEAVDIHPVIFLTEDHAFPGYWRSDTQQAEFHQRIDGNGGSRRTASADAIGGANGDRPLRWYLRARALADIRRAVRLRHLIPVETVGLTIRSGFAKAVGVARERITTTENFNSMLDVYEARQGKVTPLPLVRRDR